MSSEVLLDGGATDSAPSGLAPEVLARLAAADDPAVFAAAWLDAMGNLTYGMQQGLLVLATTRGGRNEPVASWPSRSVPDRGLLTAVEGAVRSGEEVARAVAGRLDSEN